MKRLVFAAIALATLVVGCLKVPLGDPERSKVDPALSGQWLLVDEKGEKGELASVVPYDGRTYLVTYLTFTRDAEKRPVRDEEMLFKMWLTDVSGVTFATLEPTGPNAAAAKPDEKEYLVLRLTRDGDSLRVRVVDRKFVDSHDVKTPEDLAKLLAGNLENADLYTDTPAVFERAGEARGEEVRAILTAFGLGK